MDSTLRILAGDVTVANLRPGHSGADYLGGAPFVQNACAMVVGKFAPEDPSSDDGQPDIPVGAFVPDDISNQEILDRLGVKSFDEIEVVMPGEADDYFNSSLAPMHSMSRKTNGNSKKSDVPVEGKVPVKGKGGK